MSVGLEQPATAYQKVTNRLIGIGKDIGLISDPQLGSCLPELRKAYKAGHNEGVDKHLEKLTRPGNSRQRSLFFESKAATQASPSNTKELAEPEAHELLLNIIKNGNESHSELAMKAYSLYLREANTMGIALNINGEEVPSQEQRALNALCDYHTATSPEAKREALENIVEATGFLYFEQGADKLPSRPGGNDDRLLGFYEGLKLNPNTRILYDIIHDPSHSDLMEDCQAIKDSARAQEGQIAAKPDSLLKNEDVQYSLQSVNIANTKRANLGTSRRGTNVRPGYFASLKDIQTNDAEELAFLKTLGLNIISDTAKSYNFNFNKVNHAMYDFNGSKLNGNDFGRKDIVNHFVASYFLLLRRERIADSTISKRKLALTSNTDPTQTARLKQELKEAQAIKTRSTKELKALDQVMNNPNCVDHEGEVVGTVKELLEQRRAAVIMMIATNIHRIEIESCDAEAQGIIKLAKQSWGKAAEIGSPAHELTSFEDVKTLRSESVDKYSKLSRELSDSVCSEIDPSQKFLNTEEIDKFKNLINTYWRPSSTGLVYQFTHGVSSHNAEKQHEEVIAASLAGESPKFFDIEAASEDFRNFVTSSAADSTNPDQATYQYIIDNWDKVFKNDFSSFAFTNDDTTLIKPGYTREKCIERLFAEKQKSSQDQGSGIERSLRSGKYKTQINRILDNSPSTLTAGEGIIRKTIEALTEEEISGGTLAREGEKESTIRQMLLGQRIKIDGNELITKHPDPNTRLVACTKVAQSILQSGLSPLEKDSAIDIIALQLVGINPDSYNRDDFKNKINRIASIGNQSLAQGIARNRTGTVNDFATLEQYHFMAHELSSKGIDHIRNEVVARRKPDLSRFIKTAYGHDGDAVDELMQTIETLAERVGEGEVLEQMQELAETISNTPWGTEEHTEAVSEYYNHLRSLGISPEFNLGQYLTRDGYNEAVPLLSTTFMNSENSNDFFMEMIKLLKSIFNDFIYGANHEN